MQKETNSLSEFKRKTGEVTSDGIRIIRSIPINSLTIERIGAEDGVFIKSTKWCGFKW